MVSASFLELRRYRSICARGSRPWYSCRSTKVGLLTTSAGAPSPAAMPRTSAVLPAPKAPDNARDSPPSSTEPMARPNRSVCRDEGSDRRQTRLVGRIVRGKVRAGWARLLSGDRLTGIGNLFNEIAGDHGGQS